MPELDNQQKIDYIKSCNIPYHPTEEFNLSVLYKLASTKHIADLPCFGQNQLDNPVCQACYLNQNGTCEQFKSYLKHVEKVKPKVPEKILKLGSKMTTEEINVILVASKFRTGTKTFQIAKLMLDSDNRPLSEIVEKIMQFYPNKTVNYIRIRMHQVKQRIEEFSDIKITVITQKFLHVTKK